MRKVNAPKIPNQIEVTLPTSPTKESKAFEQFWVGMPKSTLEKV